MRTAQRLMLLVLCFAVAAYSQGNSWNRVRYNGGTLPTKVKPDNWGNKLTVTSDKIEFRLKDKQVINIDPKSVTSLSYGQEAHRRVGTMVALAILISPVALFGLLAKTRLHFIGIQYTDEKSEKVGLLLQGDKDNYRAIIVALQAATGQPVAVAEADRQFVPVGITTSVARDSDSVKPVSSK